MDVDIYGDLDNLDNQFEVVQKENEQLKETVQKLEETSVKFSIEINELKRINGNLEINISSLYKTAKSEIERKNKQIAELRKELDNMLFKRGPKRKIPDKNDGNPQENQILTQQFERAQYDIDQKNRIIQSLNSELDNVRKELAERNNAFKRNSSQIEDRNEHYFKAKKPKLEKETFVGNEEDYRKYKNRYEMRENNHYNGRSKSPNYRRYNSREQNNLRSRIDLKRINYRRSRSRSREDFKQVQHNKRHNNRPNYRDARFKGRYTERAESPMEYNPNYTNTADDEKQNYFFEQDSVVFNSQTTGSSDIQESIASDTCFSVSPVLSHDDFKIDLEDGELNNTKLITNDMKFKKNIKPNKLTDENKKTQEKGKQDNKKSTKTNVSLASIPKISVNNTEKSVNDIVNSNTPLVSETKLYSLLTKKNDISKTDQELAEFEKFREKLKAEIKELEHLTDKKENKSVEKHLEKSSCIDSEKLPTIKNKNNETEETNKDKRATEFIINKDETNEEKPKIETQKTDVKKCPELKSSKDKKEKSKSDKSRDENSVSKKKSDLILSKEKTKLPSKTDSKSTKSKQEISVVNSTEIIISEYKSTDTKTTETNSELKDTNISIVSELNPVTNKKETKVSETTDTNIKVVSQFKPSKTKKEKKISESNDTNISIVSESQPTKMKIENTVTEAKDIKVVSQFMPSKTKKENKISESNDTNISVVSELQPTKMKIEKTVTETKEKNISVVSVNVKNNQSAEANLTIDSDMKNVNESVKNKLDISKRNLNTINIEKYDEIKISESTAAKVIQNPSDLFTDITCLNLNKNDSEISNNTTINSIPSTSSTLTSEEISAAIIESQNTETATQLTDRKPPLRGRRRRCVISIT